MDDLERLKLLLYEFLFHEEVRLEDELKEAKRNIDKSPMNLYNIVVYCEAVSKRKYFDRVFQCVVGFLRL